MNCAKSGLNVKIKNTQPSNRHKKATFQQAKAQELTMFNFSGLQRPTQTQSQHGFRLDDPNLHL